jgi:hypothetical protein
MPGQLRIHVAGDLIMLAALAIAVIIGAHIVFVFLEANPSNDIVSTDADWSHTLAAWFRDMFTPHDYKWRVFLNYGIAVVFYLVVGGILRRVVNSLQR